MPTPWFSFGAYFSCLSILEDCSLSLPSPSLPSLSFSILFIPSHFLLFLLLLLLLLPSYHIPCSIPGIGVIKTNISNWQLTHNSSESTHSCITKPFHIHNYLILLFILGFIWLCPLCPVLFCSLPLCPTSVSSLWNAPEVSLSEVSQSSSSGVLTHMLRKGHCLPDCYPWLTMRSSYIFPVMQHFNSG